MATAAQVQTDPVPRQLPSGEGDNKRLFCSSTSLLTVELRAATEDEPAATHQLPLGTKGVFVQHRMAGDFYCFIEGLKQVCAVAETRDDAFLAALAKASAK